MTTLQRYLLVELTKVFLFVMVINTAMMTFIGVFQQANELELEASFTMRLIPYIVPTMLPFTIPAALLLSVTIVYGRISDDNEIVAAKAAGITPGALLWPAVLVGLSTSFGTYLMMDQTIPWSARQIRKIVVNGMEDIIFQKLKVANSFRQGRTSIYVSSIDGDVLIHPVIQHSAGSNPFVLTAESALLKINVDDNLVNLTLHNASIDGLGKPSENYKVVLQGTNEFKLELPSMNRKRSGYHMSGSEVDDQLAEKRHELDFEEKRLAIMSMMGLTQARFENVVDVNKDSQVHRIQKHIWKLSTEKHGRYAMACSCLVFVLIGSTLASIMATGHYLMSFLTCFLPTVCIYYPVVLGTISQCRGGVLDPRYAVWAGNGLSLIVLIFLLRKYYQR